MIQAFIPMPPNEDKTKPAAGASIAGTLDDRQVSLVELQAEETLPSEKKAEPATRAPADAQAIGRYAVQKQIGKGGHGRDRSLCGP